MRVLSTVLALIVGLFHWASLLFFLGIAIGPSAERWAMFWLPLIATTIFASRVCASALTGLWVLSFAPIIIVGNFILLTSGIANWLRPHLKRDAILCAAIVSGVALILIALLVPGVASEDAVDGGER